MKTFKMAIMVIALVVGSNAVLAEEPSKTQRALAATQEWFKGLKESVTHLFSDDPSITELMAELTELVEICEHQGYAEACEDAAVVADAIHFKTLDKMRSLVAEEEQRRSEEQYSNATQ